MAQEKPSHSPLGQSATQGCWTLTCLPEQALPLCQSPTKVKVLGRYIYWSSLIMCSLPAASRAVGFCPFCFCCVGSSSTCPKDSVLLDFHGAFYSAASKFFALPSGHLCFSVSSSLPLPPPQASILPLGGLFSFTCNFSKVLA